MQTPTVNFDIRTPAQPFEQLESLLCNIQLLMAEKMSVSREPSQFTYFLECTPILAQILLQQFIRPLE